MKRFAAVLAAVLILFMCASAEDAPKEVKDFVTAYNSYADTYAVPALPLDGWREMSISYSLSLGDYYFDVDRSSNRSASVIVPVESIGLDFFAVCLCMTAAVRGSSTGNYADLMTVFTTLRTTPEGENAKHASKNGFMIMSESNGVLLFMVTN